MCGACPGGGRLSEATVFLGLRSAVGRGAALLSELTEGRLRVAGFGDGWTVAAPTGGMRTSQTFEEVVDWCAPLFDATAVAQLADRGRSDGDEVVAFVAEAARNALAHLGDSSFSRRAR